MGLKRGTPNRELQEYSRNIVGIYLSKGPLWNPRKLQGSSGKIEGDVVVGIYLPGSFYAHLVALLLRSWCSQFGAPIRLLLHGLFFRVSKFWV